MSDLSLSHRTRSGEVTVGTAVATSSTVDVRDVAGGMVLVGGITASATLTIYGSHNGSEFAPLYGFDGQAATMTVAADGGASPLPDAMYPLRFVRIVSDNDLGTAAVVTVALKS
jgi:hypothetical protein